MLAIQSRLSQVRSNEAVQALIGFVLLFACAQITIPIQPVPITLQTLAVMIIGLTFATRPALLAVATYLAVGALGVPVFSEWSAGLAKIVGPSGGYLVGFFIAVLVMSSLRKALQTDSFFAMLVNCTLGTAVIFALGIAWLSHYVGFAQAIQLGFVPFIIPGAIKAFLLCGALKYLR